MATKYYGIKDNWTDDDVANVIEVASEDGSVSSVKVNGVEYGGGGGVIFGPFTVTLHSTVTAPEEITINWTCIGTSGQFTGVLYGARYIEGRNTYRCVNENEIISESGTSEITVLTTPSPSLRLSSDNITSITGDATISGTTVYIKGNCDIYLEAQ